MSRPQIHPLTGRPLNIRALKRGYRHDFIGPWLPANALGTGSPAADVNVPPWLTATVSAGSGGSSILFRNLANYEGFLRMATSTDVGATATVAFRENVHLNIPGGVRSPKVGMHTWLRYGDNAGGPSVTTGATLTYAFDNTAGTSGFRVQQEPGAAYASLIVHGNATYVMDGSGGTAGTAAGVDLRSFRPAMVGVEFDARDNEVFIVNVTPDGNKKILWRRVVSAVNKTNSVQPRLIVTNTTTTQQQLNLYRFNLELWN